MRDHQDRQVNTAQSDQVGVAAVVQCPQAARCVNIHVRVVRVVVGVLQQIHQPPQDSQTERKTFSEQLLHKEVRHGRAQTMGFHKQRSGLQDKYGSSLRPTW